MLHHQLPQLISHAGAIGRDAVLYCHAATRAAIAGLLRIESPRATFRLVLQEGRSAAYRAGRRGNPFFIHYHIFKNAGSSFDWALKQAFGESAQQLDSDDPDAFITRSTIVRYAARHPDIKAVSTHQAAPPPPRVLGRPVLTSILIRDPIARIRSIYAFERWQPVDTIGANKAKELDFRRYVEWRLEVTPRLFCNYQLHFLRRQGVRSLTPLDASELQKAILALDTIDVVGTVERYDEWLTLAEAVLTSYFGKVDLPVVRLNAHATSCPKSQEEIYHDLVADLGEDLAHDLIERNEFDMRLHQVADALLTRRLVDQGAEVSLRRAYRDAQTKRQSRPARHAAR